MKTVCWGLRNVPEGADRGPGQQDREDLWECSGAEITSQGSFQLKARKRAFVLQQLSVIGSWPPLGKRKLQGTSCSLHTATPAQAAQGQTSEDCRKAG